MKRLERKHIAIGGAGMVLAIVAFMLVPGRSPTGTIAPAPAAVPPSQEARPSYAAIAERVPREYYADPVFAQCSAERFRACAKGFPLPSKAHLALTGGFLDSVNAFAAVSGQSESLDNCVGDSITSCTGIATRAKLEKEPDESLCNAYPDAVLKKNCLNDTYPKIAIFRDDVRICDKIAETFPRNACFDLYNTDKSIKNRDVSWCSRLSVGYLQENCKNNFVANVAIATKDIGFCSKWSSPSEISNCATSYVTQKFEPKNLAECQGIYDYKTYIPNGDTLESLVRQCSDKLVNRAFAALASQDPIDPDQSKAYKNLCDELSAEKEACLQRLTDFLKSKLPPEPAVPAFLTGAADAEPANPGSSR